MFLVLGTPDRWKEACDKQWHSATFQTLRALSQMLQKKSKTYERKIFLHLKLTKLDCKLSLTFNRS
jgi:hypothetical protein